MLSFKYVFPLIMNPEPSGEDQQFLSNSSFALLMVPWNSFESRLIGGTFVSNTLDSCAVKDDQINILQDNLNEY